MQQNINEYNLVRVGEILQNEADAFEKVINEGGISTGNGEYYYSMQFTKISKKEKVAYIRGSIFHDIARISRRCKEADPYDPVQLKWIIEDLTCIGKNVRTFIDVYVQGITNLDASICKAEFEVEQILNSLSS